MSYLPAYESVEGHLELLMEHLKTNPVNIKTELDVDISNISDFPIAEVVAPHYESECIGYLVQNSTYLLSRQQKLQDGFYA